VAEQSFIQRDEAASRPAGAAAGAELRVAGGDGSSPRVPLPLPLSLPLSLPPSLSPPVSAELSLGVLPRAAPSPGAAFKAAWYAGSDGKAKMLLQGQ